MPLIQGNAYIRNDGFIFVYDSFNEVIHSHVFKRVDPSNGMVINILNVSYRDIGGFEMELSPFNMSYSDFKHVQHLLFFI